MADYYPLIARAVAGLDKNTGDARRTLYERARVALVAQLRGVTPVLDESDVTRERLALEEAIRKVEGESARQSTSRTDAARLKAPEFPRWDEPEPDPEPEPPPRAPQRRPQAMPRQDGRQEGRQEGRQDGRAAGAAPSARIKPEPRYTDPDEDPSIPPDPVLRPEPPRRPQPVPRPDGRQEARQESRQETRQEGRASGPTASARNKAEARYVDSGRDRSSQDRPSDEEPAPQEPARPARSRPSGERNAADRTAADRRSLMDTGLRDFREVVSEANELGGASARANRSARETFAAVPSAQEADRSQPRAVDSDEAYLTLDDIAEPAMLEPSFVVDDSRPIPPRARQAPPAEVEREQIPRRSYGDLIRVAVAIVIVGGIGGLLLWQWPNMAAIYSMLSAPPAEVVKDNPPVTTKPKITDRIEPGGKPIQQQSDVANVAQRVVLYEEDPNDPQGKRAVGSVIWRTEAITAGSGKSPELAVRADVEIPERKMSMTWMLRRDTDPSRSTSHTIEITFKLPPDFPSGGIFNVPGIWMKPAEQTQGTALAGASVKVTAGYFLIGLSAAAPEKERNIQLLKERPWFDIPIVYTNNRRAILAMEKGTPGERAFAQAFAAWEKQ
jgi:hypothetical protein